jgi:RNA polymerase sigma-54 factor
MGEDLDADFDDEFSNDEYDNDDNDTTDTEPDINVDDYLSDDDTQIIDFKQNNYSADDEEKNGQALPPLHNIY